eukprot:6489579-Prymnesium_polylepis.1
MSGHVARPRATGTADGRGGRRASSSRLPAAVARPVTTSPSSFAVCIQRRNCAAVPRTADANISFYEDPW